VEVDCERAAELGMIDDAQRALEDQAIFSRQPDDFARARAVGARPAQ
jgi:hypothetical protein